MEPCDEDKREMDKDSSVLKTTASKESDNLEIDYDDLLR